MQLKLFARGNGNGNEKVFADAVRYAYKYAYQHIKDTRYEKDDLVQEFLLWVLEKGYLAKKEFVTYDYISFMFRTFLNRAWHTRRRSNELLLHDRKRFINFDDIRR